MSSHQDSYYHSDTGQIYYHESTSESSVAGQVRPTQQSPPATAASDDQSSYSQPPPSMDLAGTLWDIYVAEDANYPLPLNYALPNTLFPASVVETDATYMNENAPSAPSPFSRSVEIDYISFQNHYAYDPYEFVHESSDQSIVHSVHQMSGGSGTSFGVHAAQSVEALQTSQVPITPVYPHPLSTQGPFLGISAPVYQDDTSVRPIPVGSTPDVTDTGRMELPDANNRRHSHPIRVATSPAPAPGPSHSLPDSPERKRSLSAVDEHSELTARRVLPRYSPTQSGSPPSSSSRAHSHSNSSIHGRGPRIPQERYTTSSISSYKKPDQYPPIHFYLENPDQIGVPIIDVLSNGDSCARVRDPTQAFSHMGKKTFTLRVQWPGYKLWSKTIAAMDWTNARAPITRMKLAKAVATAIRDLIEKYRDEQCDPGYAEWIVGPNGIQLNQICLVAVHQVSKGSWQPELCLLEPRH